METFVRFSGPVSPWFPSGRFHSEPRTENSAGIIELPVLGAGLTPQAGGVGPRDKGQPGDRAGSVCPQMEARSC